MSSLFDNLPASEPSSRTGFAGNRIDRRSEKRSEDVVPTALADPSARVYLFRGDPALVKTGDDPLFSAADASALGADASMAVLLGWSSEGPRLAAALPETTPIDETQVAAVSLRTLATSGILSAEHLGALAQARSLLNWHNRHGFCAVCGSPTNATIGGYRRDCPSCGAEHFPRTDPVVIMLAIDTSSGGERALLGRSARFLPNMFSCLAGFVEPGETIEDAVRRETYEESGIRIGRVRYHASQPWPFPSSLMIGCHCEALSTTINRDEAELEDCRWFSREETRSLLAGHHPAGVTAPAKMAIANHLIRAWAYA
jgi:NAD+ diphosphatase